VDTSVLIVTLVILAMVLISDLGTRTGALAVRARRTPAAAASAAAPAHALVG